MTKRSKKVPLALMKALGKKFPVERSGKPLKLLVALRDGKTGVYLSPLVVSTPGEAERSYEEILRREGTIVSKHPLDFNLYEVGRFDEDSGKIFGLYNSRGVQEEPRLLLTAEHYGFGKEPKA